MQICITVSIQYWINLVLVGLWILQVIINDKVYLLLEVDGQLVLLQVFTDVNKVVLLFSVPLWCHVVRWVVYSVLNLRFLLLWEKSWILTKVQVCYISNEHLKLFVIGLTFIDHLRLLMLDIQGVLIWKSIIFFDPIESDQGLLWCGLHALLWGLDSVHISRDTCRRCFVKLWRV